MRSSIKRAIGMAGALSVAAGLALLPAQAARADGAYYGAWTLSAFKLNGTTVDCPGKLPLPPPAPPIECKAGTYLELKTNYTYKTNLSAFQGKSSKGQFDVIKFSADEYSTIIFDSYEAKDDPRSYQMKLQGKTYSGGPKKMVIFSSIGVGGGKAITVKMIFRRDFD